MRDADDRLEVLSASTGGLLLDGRGRQLTKNSLPTAIIDDSGQGNWLQGTLEIKNVLVVKAGMNKLYGGNQSDQFYSGTGMDEIDGMKGQDILYVSADSGHDEVRAVETIVFMDNLVAEDMRITREGLHARVTFTGREKMSLLLLSQFVPYAEKTAYFYFPDGRHITFSESATGKVTDEVLPVIPGVDEGNAVEQMTQAINAMSGTGMAEGVSSTAHDALHHSRWTALSSKAREAGSHAVSG